MAQMAAPGNVSDDQHVSLRLLRRAIQQLRDTAAIDDNFGLRTYVDMRSSRAADLHATIAMSRHHDKVDVTVTSHFHDFVGGSPLSGTFVTQCTKKNFPRSPFLTAF